MHRLLLLAAALLSLSTPAAAQIGGRWLTHKGKAVVEIGDCGQSLCGRIARMIVPPGDGSTTDRHNPDPALRDRPIIGVPVLTGLSAANGEWHGRIYNPEDGKSYRATVRLNRNGTLRIRGCIALFCKTLTWTRVR